MKLYSTCSFVLAIGLSASIALAQQFPSQQRGLSADTAYQLGDIDHINLFNGALTIQIPLGQTYQVSPAINFGLALSYSSNGWDYLEDQICVGQQGVEEWTESIESPHSNVAFGWRIVPGKIVSRDIGPIPRTYIGPDGSERGFYDQLYPGQGSNSNVWYSRDSTYLRMKKLSPGSCTLATGGSLDCHQIEFPNGAVHEFHDFGTGSMEEKEWLLTRIFDRFAADQYVELDYSNPAKWQISDSHGRTHAVNISGGRISSVDLAGFDDSTSTYNFQTASRTLTRRILPAQPDCSVSGPPPATSINVPVLTRITLPDTSAYRADYSTVLSSSELPGAIKWLRLPTGGEYAWTYGQIDFVLGGPPDLFQEYISTAWAVQSKKLYTISDDTGSLIGQWSYAYETHLSPDIPPDPDDPGVPCYHRVIVTDPSGDETVNYFDSQQADSSKYGLPLRYCPDIGDPDPEGVFLSQEVYSGDRNGTLLRRIYVDYENDFPTGLKQEKNNRLRGRRVEYEDDAGRFKQTVFSDFDNIGHYQTATTIGNFAGDDRTATTAYGGVPGLSDPWILGTYTSQTVQEDGDTTMTELCFADDGFLERTRRWQGSDKGASDLLTVFEQELDGSSMGTGRVAAVLSYGGDADSLPLTGDSCTISLDQPERRLEHTYQYGTLRTSSYVDPQDTTAVVLEVADHDIDQNTGRVSLARDTAELATELFYDSMGRLVREEPEEGAWTIYTYDLPPATSYSPPELTVVQCPNLQTSCEELSWTKATYDGLGRQTSEWIEIASGGSPLRARRDFHHDAFHRKTFESLWGDTNEGTEYSYDRFGRVLEIDYPDSSLAPTLFRYRGDQRIDRSNKVATDDNGFEHYVCFREEYDAFGRLVLVNENRGSTGMTGLCDGNASGGIVTTYSYDELDNLVAVNAPGQQRLFNYDNRGFLLSEQHPEIGPSGHGTASYTYNASGNALSKVITDSQDFSLFYTYDPANRLIKLEENAAGGLRPLKEFQYARSDRNGDRSKGKLVLSKRVNWVDPQSPLEGVGTYPATVSQAYRYEGLGGRVSERQTRVTLLTSHDVFRTSFEYDQLGNTRHIEYPSCLYFPCNQRVPSREVDFERIRGFLSAVPGYADSISYALGGMVHKIEHANNVVENIAVPANGLQRPGRIFTEGVTRGEGDWDTGLYFYDGSGNVKDIGGQYFKYDRMSRLVEGQVEVGGVTKEQSVTYDAVGNITGITTEGPTEVTPVEMEGTNRLQNATYDAGGNVGAITLGGVNYEYDYDALNVMKHLRSSSGQARVFLYDANDERIINIQCATVLTCGGPGEWRATVRGLDGKVLQELERVELDRWKLKRDVVYRDGLLLAAVENARTLHFHLDHLGTPRQITNQVGTEVARHTYYPFGGEATDPSQDEVTLKFTGHERDENGSSGPGMLDYMHARFHSPLLGRFLSPDKIPVPRETLGLPNRWNRYAYAANNPLTYVDPSGNTVVLYIDSGNPTELLNFFKSILTNADATAEASSLRLGSVDGELHLTSEVDFSGSTNPVAKLIGSAIKSSQRISFRMRSKGLEDKGGGLTDSTNYPTEIAISVNPKVISRLRVRGTALSGPAAGGHIDDNLLVPVSLEAAVVHEFGHAFGTFGEGIVPNVGGNTVPWALKYENHYRRLSGEGTMRSLQGEKGFLLDN